MLGILVQCSVRVFIFAFLLNFHTIAVIIHFLKMHFVHYSWVLSITDWTILCNIERTSENKIVIFALLPQFRSKNNITFCWLLTRKKVEIFFSNFSVDNFILYQSINKRLPLWNVKCTLISTWYRVATKGGPLILDPWFRSYF